MFDRIELLRQSRIVLRLDIFNFVDEEDIQIFNAIAILHDGSVLSVRELITQEENRYSYHWQTSIGKLICRWDNAPHYPKIETFPHHKHEGRRENVLPSYETTLEAILHILEEHIT